MKNTEKDKKEGNKKLLYELKNRRLGYNINRKKVWDRTKIEESIQFINTSNINYCLAYFDDDHKNYLASYSTKKHKLVQKLSIIDSQRKLLATLSELKRFAGKKEVLSNFFSWINFSNRLQINWISTYLQQIDEFDIFELIVENEINKNNKFFVFSQVAHDNNISIGALLEEARERWGYIYNCEDLDWIEKKNIKQLKWIYSYIKKIDLSREINLSLPTNELEKFEYIYIILSLCITFPDLCSEEEGDDKKQTPDMFINRIKKSWQVYNRRTLKKEDSIYKALPTGIRSRLKKLSKENECTAEEMIEFMIDTYQDAP